ncbi:hypothetical protein F511_16788 [Dorcoceras hygrometricum]|uniref:Uncharacterized protein n=1 Tax=Dorcoceras hygrometricum TaxID=472368 RepID=A0A2Z7AZ31_9LAMI|nr:hypothetical protein F511_16788 [Dorcoceras hygrometricum]
MSCEPTASCIAEPLRVTQCTGLPIPVQTNKLTGALGYSFETHHTEKFFSILPSPSLPPPAAAAPSPAAVDAAVAFRYDRPGKEILLAKYTLGFWCMPTKELEKPVMERIRSNQRSAISIGDSRSQTPSRQTAGSGSGTGRQQDPLEDFDYSDPHCNPFQQPNRLQELLATYVHKVLISRNCE